jgi:hypothetical protein
VIITHLSNRVEAREEEGHARNDALGFVIAMALAAISRQTQIADKEDQRVAMKANINIEARAR